MENRRGKLTLALMTLVLLLALTIEPVAHRVAYRVVTTQGCAVETLVRLPGPWSSPSGGAGSGT